MEDSAQIEAPEAYKYRLRELKGDGFRPRHRDLILNLQAMLASEEGRMEASAQAEALVAELEELKKSLDKELQNNKDIQVGLCTYRCPFVRADRMREGAWALESICTDWKVLPKTYFCAVISQGKVTDLKKCVVSLEKDFNRASKTLDKTNA